MTPPTPPTAAPAGARPRTRYLLLALLGGAVLLGAWWWHSRPAVPDLPLDGADPAVVAAVRRAQEEVRREPRSADAWGRLGMVLSANHLPEPAAGAFAQAAALAPQDERWPYLHGLALLPLDPTAALPFLRRAA